MLREISDSDATGGLAPPPGTPAIPTTRLQNETRAPQPQPPLAQLSSPVVSSSSSSSSSPTSPSPLSPPVAVAPQNRHLERFNERVFAFPESVLIGEDTALAQRVTYTGVEACGEFRARGGTGVRQVWRRFHQPSHSPRAVLFYLHGLHSHSRFLMDHVLEVLTQAGLVVFGLDIEGHGLSDGCERYFRRLSSVVDAWEEFIGWAVQQRDHAALPFFLLGWSLGGTLGIQLSRRLMRDAPGGSCAAASKPPSNPKTKTNKKKTKLGACWGRQSSAVVDLSSVKEEEEEEEGGTGGTGAPPTTVGSEWRDRYRGSCLLCPSTSLPDGISPLLVAASAALSALVPRLPIPLPVDYAELDPKIQQYKQLADRLDRAGAIRARVGRELLRAQRDIQDNRGYCRFPFLLLHGDRDVTCPPEGSVQFYNHAASPDKDLFLVPNLRHELLRDPGNHVVLDRILTWIETRIVAAPADKAVSSE